VQEIRDMLKTENAQVCDNAALESTKLPCCDGAADVYLSDCQTQKHVPYMAKWHNACNSQSCIHTGSWKSRIMHVPYRKLEVAQCKQQCDYGCVTIRPALL